VGADLHRCCDPDAGSGRAITGLPAFARFASRPLFLDLADQVSPHLREGLIKVALVGGGHEMPPRSTGRACRPRALSPPRRTRPRSPGRGLRGADPTGVLPLLVALAASPVGSREQCCPTTPSRSLARVCFPSSCAI
jgi:hypothetical protein